MRNFHLSRRAAFVLIAFCGLFLTQFSDVRAEGYQISQNLKPNVNQISDQKTSPDSKYAVYRVISLDQNNTQFSQLFSVDLATRNRKALTPVIAAAANFSALLKSRPTVCMSFIPRRLKAMPIFGASYTAFRLPPTIKISAKISLIFRRVRQPMFSSGESARTRFTSFISLPKSARRTNFRRPFFASRRPAARRRSLIRKLPERRRVIFSSRRTAAASLISIFRPPVKLRPIRASRLTERDAKP